MGSPRLIQITHARRGIPWRAIGVVAAPAVALIASAFIFYRSDVAWSLLRQGMLAWAVTAAFLFDEPPAPVVKATPRSPTWWHGTRFLGAVPLLAVPILAANVWAIDRPDAQPFGLSIQTIAAWLMVLAGAAVASRVGRNAPGDVVASGAVLTVLFLLIRPISIGGVPLLPYPADPKWDQSIRLWSVLGTAAVITIAVSGWWQPRPKPTQSPPWIQRHSRPRPIANETSATGQMAIPQCDVRAASGDAWMDLNVARAGRLVDESAAAAFWQRYRASVGQDSGERYTDVACFGDSVELADELIDLVLQGRKRATARSLAEYESEGIALPAVGDRWIACDGRGRPRVVIETTEVRVGPLSSVDEQFAWDEGEGDRTRADWLRNHTAYFTRTHTALGIPFHPDILVAFERFAVVYQEPDQQSD